MNFWVNYASNGEPQKQFLKPQRLKPSQF